MRFYAKRHHFFRSPSGSGSVSTEKPDQKTDPDTDPDPEKTLWFRLVRVGVFPKQPKAMTIRTVRRNITFRRLLLDMAQMVRCCVPATRLLGRPFARSLRYIELDITYRCNLRCPNCNRSCTQAPDDREMSPDQIRAFVEESIAAGWQWERIHLMGGEPTLHRDFESILGILRHYRDHHNPGMRIVLCSNEQGPAVRRALARLPADIDIRSSPPTSRPRLFRPFNMAPRDQRRYRWADYGSGCRIMAECGMGLTPLGYYPCAIAGGIDRIFGYRIGRSHLPATEDTMADLLEVFCPLCGHFGFAWPTRKARISPTWDKAYTRFKERQFLDRYYRINAKNYHNETAHVDPAPFLEPLGRCLAPGATVVDVGCGSGRDLLWMRQRGFTAIGIEKSPALAELARSHSGCAVIEADFETFDFAGLPCDALLLVGALVHLPHERLIPFIHRVVAGLKPGGWVVLSLKQGRGSHRAPDGRVFYLWQESDLTKAIHHTGLSVVSFSRQGSLLGNRDIWLTYRLKKAVPVLAKTW